MWAVQWTSGQFSCFVLLFFIVYSPLIIDRNSLISSRISFLAVGAALRGKEKSYTNWTRFASGFFTPSYSLNRGEFLMMRMASLILTCSFSFLVIAVASLPLQQLYTKKSFIVKPCTISICKQFMNKRTFARSAPYKALVCVILWSTPFDLRRPCGIILSDMSGRQGANFASFHDAEFTTLFDLIQCAVFVQIIKRCLGDFPIMVVDKVGSFQTTLTVIHLGFSGQDGSTCGFIIVVAASPSGSRIPTATQSLHTGVSVLTGSSSMENSCPYLVICNVQFPAALSDCGYTCLAVIGSKHIAALSFF